MSKRNTTHRERIEIVQMHQQGMTYPEIVGQTDIGYYTVRRWCRAQRDGGWEAPPQFRGSRQGSEENGP